MSQSPRSAERGGLPTTTSLLDGLRDTTDSAWTMFTETYRPVIVGYCRRIGFDHADAEDLAQQTLAEFSRAYLRGGFDRRKGRLRDWLFGIVRNQARSMRRTQARDVARAVAAFRDGEPDGDEGAWEDHWRASILERCLRIASQEFEPNTIEAFRLFAILQCPAAAVAAELGISENAVYLSKRRVLGRIRDLADQMEKGE